VFLDGFSSCCKIYEHRPEQCRSQTCWDDTQARQLTSEPELNRQKLFDGEGLQVLRDLIKEHDRRCAFENLRDACERLKKSNGENVTEVLELIAFEDHYRHFVAERLNLSPKMLDLYFGRSFAELVKYFDLQVKTEPDGSRVLLPREDHK
jgi:hypothetical protein